MWLQALRSLRKAALAPLRQPLAPLPWLRDYWGEQVTFYFAWMSFYVHALLLPAVCGAIIWPRRPCAPWPCRTATLKWR